MIEFLVIPWSHALCSGGIWTARSCCSFWILTVQVLQRSSIAGYWGKPQSMTPQVCISLCHRYVWRGLFFGRSDTTTLPYLSSSSCWSSSSCSHRCPCLGKSRGRQKLDASGQEIRFLFHFSTFGPLFLFYSSRNDGCLIHLLCAKKLSLFLVPVCSETKKYCS